MKLASGASRQQQTLQGTSVKAMRDVLSNLDNLPTLPGIAVRILEAVQAEDTSLMDFAEILSTDPPLSAEVLRLINSPYYGLHTKVTNAAHAVKLLGITTVKNLALSFSLINNFCNDHTDVFDYTQFWKDSLTSALTAKLLTQQIDPGAAEDAFFLGLLHDIGVLALTQCMPDQYQLVLNERRCHQLSYQDAENRVLGFNHMQVGQYLVESWGLPETFVQPIGYHHHPEQLNGAGIKHLQPTQILHLSTLIVDFINLPDKPLNLGLIDYHFKQYRLPQTIQVDALIDQCQSLAAEVFPIFEIQIDSETSYLEMIETARKELIHLSSDFMGRLIEQQKQIERLNEQATHDGLTKLINYQRFQELLDEEMYRAKRYDFDLSLLLADVDNFKQINDTYGHLAGDFVLRTLAECLDKSLRKSDMAARYGGEEFAIVLPETPLEGAMILADRIRRTIEGLAITFEGDTITVTVSIGVAGYSPDADFYTADLVQKADDALYRAKASGKNRTCRSHH